MGLFKLFKDSIDSVREQLQNLDEVQQRVKKKLEDVQQLAMEQKDSLKQKVEENLSMNSIKRAENNWQSQVEDDANDDEEGPRIVMGKYEDGVLEIREGITHLDCMSFSEYKHLRKIIFPASLEEIEEQTIVEQEELEELDFSRVTQLMFIPDAMIDGKTKIREFIIPECVARTGDCFLGELEGARVYVPASVRVLGSITGMQNNSLDVYLFASGLDIEGAEWDAKTLYVLPEDYVEYAQKLKECDSEARLREMPDEAYDVYHYAKPEPEPEPEAEQEPIKEVESSVTAGGLYSPYLEGLISAALQDGVLTDQKRAVILRRAEKEGEDPDEVEMILNARLSKIKKAKGIV